MFNDRSGTHQKGTSRVKITSTRRVRVEPDGEGVVAQVGLHALGSLADQLGLADELSGAMPWQGSGVPVHDRGKVLTQTALMLAGGGECCSDIEYLRLGSELFGSVPSDTTVARCFGEIGPQVRASVEAAIARVRTKVWDQLDEGDDPVVLDIDASLVDVHSENKQQTAATYKGGFGFHPMFCFADATGEALSGTLRPGNAAANKASDHLGVLDDGIDQLPEEIAAGHRVGDDPNLVKRQVVVRTDSAGFTAEFLNGCGERNIGFFTSARKDPQVTAAIDDAEGIVAVWEPALRADGTTDEDTVVAELTSLIDTAKLPAGTRLVVRREPLHPGAQRSLFPSMQFRYWGFYTDQDGTPPELDLMMRQHAHVEQHIQRLKDSGLSRFPFTDFDTNAAWMTAVMLAADLVRWYQLICLPEPWRDARPKTLRWAIFSAPGRIIHTARQRIVRLIAGWPTTQVICDSYNRINLLT